MQRDWPESDTGVDGERERQRWGWAEGERQLCWLREKRIGRNGIIMLYI